jgi:hypothetical protein
MKTNINIKAIFIILVLAVFCLSALALTKAEALEPKLLWEKEFKSSQNNKVDIARESGHVIVSDGKKEVILYDREGNELFHWGPRIDRHCGGVRISDDGKYFTFYSGYTMQYAEEKRIHSRSDDRIHFYSSETKKELWSTQSSESMPVGILPEGSGVVTSGPFMDILNSTGSVVFRHTEQWVYGVVLSPDGNYIAVVQDSLRPLKLFKRDGTLLWERGLHSGIVSISDDASYITTEPYLIHSGYPLDKQQSIHRGVVYDRDGNIIMEGYGIVSGNGKRVLMHKPDGIVIYSLPEKKLIKELPGKIELPKRFGSFFAEFSYDGNYLAIRDGDSIHVHDLGKDEKEEISVPGMGKNLFASLSIDGKYLLVAPSVTDKILFYQLY